ncbi:MAG: hypothetical protein Q4C65_07965 [Eubacteriales bacterium]|nr:hypothetical protein [Eubacteriales bacterium]
MNENNVLDAWIMVEHLSEGDISMTDQSIIHWDEDAGRNCCFFKKGISPQETDQDIVNGYKFSFALCFDKNLKLNSKMTFVSASYFIRKLKKLPDEKAFSSFEEELRKKTEELFECEETENYPAHFNTAIATVLRKNNVEIKNCRMRVVENLETGATNLHSFFVDDLQKAKKVIRRN